MSVNAQTPPASLRDRLSAMPRSRQVGYAAVVAAVILLTVAVSLWMAHAPGAVITLNPNHTPPGETDQIESALDAAINQNIGDFNRWYKWNIVIQALTIVAGILSTVLASLATREDAKTTRLVVVALTAMTTGLIAVQSTFHIRENLDTFIKANSDLEATAYDYILRRDSALKASDKQALVKLTLQSDTLKSMVRIVESRMRAYSAIGAQQARGESSDLTRPDPPHSPVPADAPPPPTEDAPAPK